MDRLWRGRDGGIGIPGGRMPQAGIQRPALSKWVEGMIAIAKPNLTLLFLFQRI